MRAANLSHVYDRGMGKYWSTSHSRYTLKYHFVWCTKYRRKLLDVKERSGYFQEVLLEIGERYWFEFDTVGTDGNHVHLFLGAAPRYSPAEIAKIIKSITARELFKKFPEIRKKLWGGEFWEDGYFVRSVGDEVTEEVIRQYIKKQGRESRHAAFEQMALFSL